MPLRERGEKFKEYMRRYNAARSDDPRTKEIKKRSRLKRMADPKRQAKELRLQCERNRIYYLEHTEEMRQRTRDYDREHPEHAREYRKANLDKIQDSYYRRAYGISLADKRRMLAEQDGRCAICKREFKNARERHLDHDHTTKAVRGVLCIQCNNGIGLFADSPNMLRSGAVYLERSETRYIASLWRMPC